jgi:uncharacterized protein
MAVVPRLPVDDARLDEYCRRWRIAKLELFGSMLHEPSRALDVDVDLLVTFAAGASWGLFEHERMERKLSELLGRKVDLISRRAIESSENVLRRNSILGDAVPV